MGELRRPPLLQPGDRVAAVTLSWGGAGKFPHRYHAGVRQLTAAFGVEVIPTRHALRDPAWVAREVRLLEAAVIAADP